MRNKEQMRVACHTRTARADAPEWQTEEKAQSVRTTSKTTPKPVLEYVSVGWGCCNVRAGISGERGERGKVQFF
jgi:hypothetical protein